jgi:hypothetical protein
MQRSHNRHLLSFYIRLDMFISTLHGYVCSEVTEHNHITCALHEIWMTVGITLQAGNAMTGAVQLPRA